MAKSIFSQHWYRVAEIKPRLKRHSQILRHVYRDQVWYVLQDSLTGSHHRFSPAAYQLIGHMDGRKTMQQIWEDCVAHLGADAPSQDEAVQLLGRLHSVDVLSSDLPPNVFELFQRHSQYSKQQWKQRLMSPMAIKIPLFDPDKLLSKWAFLLKPAFSAFGFAVWLAIVIWAVFTAGMHWSELTDNLSDTVLSPQNILVISLLFPVIKGLHELGHAFSVKVWGGEVHEIGVMLLVFMPVPYVDASAASAFRESYRRMVVGAAGMMVETSIAAFALWLWVDADPGFVKTIAYNVILITGVTTVVFNANPLLRFDGYYIFADLLQIPNLSARANKYFFYLLQRYLLGVKNAESPALLNSEKKWLLGYSVSSFVYRTLVSVAISLFIATRFFIVGIALALWSLTSMFVFPIVKGIGFVLFDRRIDDQKPRIMMKSAGVAALFVVALLCYPFPRWTNAEGIVLLPETSYVRVKVSCVVAELLAKPGDQVNVGQPLMRCEDPLLLKEKRVKAFELEEAQVKYVAALSEDSVKAEMLLGDVQALQSELDHLQQQLQDLIVKSGGIGRFYVPMAQNLKQQFLKKGQIVGYVIPHESMTVRTVVGQKDVGYVRRETRKIEVRRVSNVNSILAATMQREVPGAGNQLPSPVLGVMGGGAIAVDPRHQDGLTAFDKVFQFDVKVSGDVVPTDFGERVYVRFYHDGEPIVQQWYQRVRLLLQERFSV